MTLLSNSAACHLALADAMSPARTGVCETRGRKTAAYQKALDAAVEAVGLANSYSDSALLRAKVLMRAGKAAVGRAKTVLLTIEQAGLGAC